MTRASLPPAGTVHRHEQPSPRPEPGQTPGPTGSKSLRGLRAHLSGLAAEEIALRLYQERGCQLLETRWRGAFDGRKGGEIDLILQSGETLIFAEVKKSRDLSTAALRITPQQIQRLRHSAAAYLETQPKGQLTCSRLDAVLIDGAGNGEILENALAFL